MAALRAAWVVVAVLAFFCAVPAASSPPRAHGGNLVAQFELPGEAVAHDAAVAEATSRNEPAGKGTAWADTARWVGPLQQVGAGRNPYTLVLTVSGTARAAGDIGARWQAGWEVRESPLATREVLMPVRAQQRGKTVAGAAVTLTAVSAPLSFRGARQASPMLTLVEADNLDIRDVQLQVWSGSAPMLAWPALAAPRPAWLGLGTLCLLMWFFLRRTARPLAMPMAVNARLAQAAVQPVHEHHLALTDRPVAPALPAPAPAPLAASAPQNPSSRVVQALRDVLIHGLVVPTEFDVGRRRRSAG
jgi:hypothetical protein